MARCGREHFDVWVFVHNDYHGLAPDILKKLLDLEAANQPLRTQQCGFEELRVEVFGMDLPALTSLLGLAPTARDMMQIGLEDLRPILANIAGQRPTLDDTIRPVPADKIEANGLSEHVEALLKFGMQRADLVSKFFARWHDPTFGESIAQTFSQAYKGFQAEGLTPDEIFVQLQIFAGGEGIGTAAHQSSVLAVLSYLFERCHIFEPSRSVLL